MFQFWQHKVSGEVHAVLVGDDGRVVGASEALYFADYEAHPASEFDTPSENADWFNEHEAEFKLYEPQV